MKYLRITLNIIALACLLMVCSPAQAADVCLCDLNRDTRCNMLDWQLFGKAWGHVDCLNVGVVCECDLNKDGRCNMLDWQLFGKSWGRADCPILSNATLQGAWITTSENDPTYEEKAYFIFDGSGHITDMGAFALDTQDPGTYSVSPDGKVSMTLRSDDGSQWPVAGTLTKDTEMDVVFDNSQGQTVTCHVVKVPDQAFCEGVWEGVLIENGSPGRYPIIFIVDGTGAVTYFDGFPYPVTGRMFSNGSVVNSFFRTGAVDKYDQFSIVGGQISNNAFSGYFVNDSGAAVDGTIELFRSGKMVDADSYIEVCIDPHCDATGYYMQCYIDDQTHTISSARLEGPYGQRDLEYNGSPSHTGTWSIPGPNENIQVPGTFPQKWTAVVNYTNGSTEFFDQVIVGCDSP